MRQLLAYWTGDLAIGLGRTIPFTPQVDASVLAASLAAMSIAVMASAVWPALQSTRSDVRAALGAGHGATPPKWRLHRTIIAWQVCGSVSLLLATRAETPSEGRLASDIGAVTIVGVSADDEPWDNGQRKPLIFLPFAQRYDRFLPVTFIARAVDPVQGVAALRASIRRVDPDLPVGNAATSVVLVYGFYPLRLIAIMATSLRVLALVLAMAGLFGVLSHVVMKRTREMGIRLAIGAERSGIFRLVLGDGLQPVGKGLLLGLGIGFASRIAVSAFVVTNVSPVDPWPLVLLPVPFVVAALAACYFPAARASRVDPNVALRDQ
jgi:hypothetical protein